jgi:hypothetical protein
MSGHHSLSRPSPQNSSHPSTTSSYVSHEGGNHASSGTTPEGSRPSQSRASLSQEGVAEADSDGTQPEMEVDVQPRTSPALFGRPPNPSPPPNPAMASSPKASPRSKPEGSSAHSSPAVKAMSVSVSPRQRTDGFNPPSRRGSGDAKDGEEQEAKTRSANQTSGISLSRSDSSLKGGDGQSSSPEQSNLPRGTRVIINDDGVPRKPNKDGTATSQPTSNSDSSNTPASSPPPQTPNSDDTTHHGDPPSSMSENEKRIETPSSSDETKEAASPTDPSATPHMDLATYPTQDLLKLLASLLHQIASANDTLREEAFSNKVDNASPTLTSRPSSPSTRNRTRTASGSEVAGQLCIPAFRPRPANAEQSQEQTQPPATHSAKDDTAVPEEVSNQQEGATNDQKSAAEPASEASAEPEAAGAAVVIEHTDEHAETPEKAFTATPDTAKTSLPETETTTDSTGSTNTLQSRRSDSYRITTTAARQSLVHPSAILCFHARNVPSISIEAYLQRILKYCPITNEVFLSLLVYFDRMSKMQLESGQPNGTSIASEVKLQTGIQGFAIDSYNVHRLVIAGITVASKFFSDVFYTNSRYAKVRRAGYLLKAFADSSF